MTIDMQQHPAPLGLSDRAWPGGVTLAAAARWLVHGKLIPFSERVPSLFLAARDIHTCAEIAFCLQLVPTARPMRLARHRGLGPCLRLSMQRSATREV